jgi:uncharacterized tellurite resistance protein B-like protein
MIQRLAGLLRRLEAGPEASPARADIELAACALLVEAAMMDGSFADEERATIARLIATRFGMGADETAALIDEAERLTAASPDLFRFTNAIKTHFNERERIGLMEMLWEVAYADGTVDAYEDNLLRRIAGLIYVTDRDRGLARARVLERLGRT